MPDRCHDDDPGREIVGKPANDPGSTLPGKAHVSGGVLNAGKTRANFEARIVKYVT